MKKSVLLILLVLVSCDYQFNLGDILKKPRDLSGNALLATLDINNQAITLTPPFDPHLFQYTVTLPHDQDSITLGAQCIDPSSRVTSGVGYHALSPGDNLLAVDVTAESGAIANYQILIHRNSFNPFLASLSLSQLTINFTPGQTSYDLTVPYTVDSTQVTAATQDSYSTIAVNSVALASGAQSQTINLADPAQSLPTPAPTVTVIEVRVFPEEGPSQTYTINITRNLPDNTNSRIRSFSLKGVDQSPIAIYPEFDPQVTSYTAIVSESLSSLILSASTEETTASMVSDGAVPGDFSLFTGSGSVINSTRSLSLRGIAQNTSFTTTYTVNITRLKVITLNPGEIVCNTYTPEMPSTQVTISGGAGAYSVTKIAGESTFSFSGNILTFTPAAVPEKGILLIRDSTGAGAYLPFTVNTAYMLVPAVLSPKAGKSITFKVSGGAGAPYTVSRQSGSGSVSGGPGEFFTFTAVNGDQAVLLVKDKDGSSYLIQVKPSLDSFALSPSYVKQGNTIEMTPTGGTGTGYAVSLQSNPPGLFLTYNNIKYYFLQEFQIPTNGTFFLTIPPGISRDIYIRVDDIGTGQSFGFWNKLIQVVP